MDREGRVEEYVVWKTGVWGVPSHMTTYNHCTGPHHIAAQKKVN